MLVLIVQFVINQINEDYYYYYYRHMRWFHSAIRPLQD